MSFLTSEQMKTLTDRAMRDLSFRQALLENPRTAVHNHLGIEIPMDKTLHVLQGEEQTVTLVIPHRPADWPEYLSVEDSTARLMQGVTSTDEKTRNLTEAQMKLFANAWADETFKQALLRDPKMTVTQTLEVAFPAELDIKILADDESHQYMVLPPSVEDVELSDEQLEFVSGGEVAVIVATVIATGFYASAAYTVSKALDVSW